jgi:hypothetical protein
VITDLPSTIPEEEVHRLLGYPPGHTIPERVQSLLTALLTEAPSLLEPRGASECFALSDAALVQLPLPGARSALSGFALGLVTIGPRLEERTTAALEAGETIEALLLDAIGSAAAEAAADTLGGLLARMDGGPAESRGPAGSREQAGGGDGARGSGRESGRGAGCGPASFDRAPAPAMHPVLDFAVDPGLPSCRISPGYGGWPLTAQKAIFARLPHDAIGVRLLPSMLMVPQKSVTFALWFDPAGSVIASRGGCSLCELEPCPRRECRQRGDPA